MRINGVSSDLDFMSCYSMKKDFDHFRGYEKYGLRMNLCISRVVVPCEDPCPLEKIMIFHEVDYGRNKYEFYLNKWEYPKSMERFDMKEV